jgi:hypothetical protein
MCSKNKILNFVLFFLFIPIFFIFSNDILTTVDNLDYNGKYSEALKILTENNDPANPDLKIIWRIGRETFEVGDRLLTKDEKVIFFDQGIEATKSFIDIDYGNKRDRAEIIHWYAVNYASKMKVLGIFAGRESMKVLPNVFKLIDRCIKIDPTYTPAYFFKAKLQEDVPFFLGGDKFEMAINYQKVLKYAEEKENFFYMVDIAKSFYNRNWSIKKKEKALRNNESYQTDGTPPNLSDREYAYQLFLNAKQKYDNSKKHSKRDIDKYKELLKLIEQIKE